MHIYKHVTSCALTDSDFGPAEREEADVNLSLSALVLLAVEHDVAEHVHHDGRQTARQTLHRREVTAHVTFHHRQPQVILLQTSATVTTTTL